MAGGYQHSQQLEIIQWKDIIYITVREFNGVGLVHFFSCFLFVCFLFFFWETPALCLLHMRMKKSRREEEHDLLKTRPTNVTNCVFD
jgi:hypothetical protein